MKTIFKDLMNYANYRGELLKADFISGFKYSQISFKTEEGTFTISITKEEEEKTNE